MTQIVIKPILLTDPFHIIIRGCRENDLQSQERLYRHCYPEMIRVCQRYARDMDGAGIIFNNAMLRVFKHIHNYKEEGRMMGWIRTIVVNCCIDFVNRQNRFKDQPVANLSQYEIDIPAEIFNQVSSKEIQNIINQLPKATATVFNLYIYEGFTHKQVAGALGIAEGTSKWHVNEARRLLKSRLEDFLNPELRS